ncbi:MAG TPA: radical SAM protein [Bacteroidales bacterium]|nr:radical SAM protein [Bacteroidales bacterium]
MNDLNNIFCLLVSPVFNPGKKNLLMMVRQKDPPLNLAMLSGWIREKGFDTAILDCGVQAETPEAFNKILHSIYAEKKHKSIYVGFYVCTPTAHQCYDLSKIVRQIIPNCTILAGGPHATFLPEEVILQSEVDIVVMNEGEITLEEILSQKPLETIKGIAYLNKKGNIVQTLPRERITNLDKLPMPAYDLLEIKKYRPPIGSFIRLPSFIVSFSRGCNNNCFFCTKTIGNGGFQKSPQKIFEEINYLKTNFGIIDFVFVDDTFTAYKNSVIEFCNLLITNKTNITWHCYSRVDTIDRELLKIMKESGCHQIMYGIESFDDNVLKTIKKNITSEQSISIIKMTQEFGISVRLSMMVGNIGDSTKACESSIKMILKLKPDFINVLIATPGPGTPFFKWAKNQNRIKTYDWSKYTGASAIVELNNFSEKQIYKYFRKFWVSFYFHPAIILKHLKKLTNKVALFNIKEAIIRIITFCLQRHEK